MLRVYVRCVLSGILVCCVAVILLLAVLIWSARRAAPDALVFAVDCRFDPQVECILAGRGGRVSIGILLEISQTLAVTRMV